MSENAGAVFRRGTAAVHNWFYVMFVGDYVMFVGDYANNHIATASYLERWAIDGQLAGSSLKAQGNAS